MPQAKTEAALQFLECCAAEVALQHWLFCNAEVILTKSCAATSERLHCNIEKAALQESGAFLPLFCGFQAPTFRHPRFGLADTRTADFDRKSSPGDGALSPSTAGTSGRISGKFRKDRGNTLRAFSGIPLESTAGIPQTLIVRNSGRRIVDH